MILRQRSKSHALVGNYRTDLRYSFLIFNTNDRRNQTIPALAPLNNLEQTESYQQYIMTFNNEHNQ